ncbi:hypothetical protein BJY24_006067 [Nocardia transvalensis]|uniref:Uncharacterized protein n=1 Tax=Nocardia transvalensis TaxID=37333 RepID=A0A7W9PJL9_9NOCA|nr:hypothetical protein [Nocardia transvalensis]MBB5917155.1 hypothetical protein [Nocardia transvalensis]
MDGSTWTGVIAALIFALGALALLTVRFVKIRRRDPGDFDQRAATAGYGGVPTESGIPENFREARTSLRYDPDATIGEDGRPKRTNRVAPRDNIDR